MFVQLQFQHLAIRKLKLELLSIEVRIVLVDDAMIIGADDNDVRRVVVLRTREVVDVMSLYHAVAIQLANLLATYLVAIVVKLLEHTDDAAIYFAVLYQQFLLNYRGRLVSHEELVIVARLIHLLRNII